MPTFTQAILDWFNADPIPRIGLLATVVTAVPIIFGWMRNAFGIPARIKARFGRKPYARQESTAYEVIARPDELFSALYGNAAPGVFSDTDMPYTPRDAAVDLQADLRSALNQRGKLLITAPSGYGKTREMGMLVESLIREGFCALLVRPSGWLDVPTSYPSGLPNNRIVLVLDDLNRLLPAQAQATVERETRAADARLPSYQERLVRFVRYFEQNAVQVRVMATAKDDVDTLSNVDHGQTLAARMDDRLWQEFARRSLIAFEKTQKFALLKAAAAKAGVPAEDSELQDVVRASDGNPRNVRAQLQKFQQRGTALTAADYTPTLNGTWADRYASVLRRYPAARWVYDALDVLQQAGAPLRADWTQELARVLCGNAWQRLRWWRPMARALRFLQRGEMNAREGVLRVADGQVQARGVKRPELLAHVPLLLRLLGRHKAAEALFSFGNALYQQRDWAQAESAWRAAIAADAKLAQAHYNLGVLLDDLGRTDEAEGAYRAAIAADAKHASAHSNLGNLLKEMGRTDEAEGAYRAAIAADAKHASAHYNLGNLLKEMGRTDEAEGAYRAAIAADAKDAQAHYNLGNLLKEMGRTDEAEGAYRAAIAADAKHASAHYNLGNLLKEMGRTDEAEGAYRAAIAADAKDAQAHYNLGVLLKEMGRTDEAEGAYRAAIAADAKDAQAHYNLGLLLKEMGRTDEAEGAYRAAIAADAKDAQAHYNLGLLLKEMGRTDEAEAAFRAAIAADAKLAQAHSNLGVLLKGLGRTDEAEGAYRAAIAADAKLAQAHYNLGLLLKEMGRTDEAEGAYRAAIAADAKDAQAHYNLGLLLKEMGRTDEAEGAYRAVIDLQPDDQSNYIGIVLLLREQGRVREALPFAHKRAELAPENYHALLALASMHKHLGEMDACARYAALARNHTPEDEPYDWACLELVCGNPDVAFAHLQQAAQAPDFDRAWAWRDPDLVWIRDDAPFAARFAEICGEEPTASA